jgi:hypothetical protein
MIMLAAALAGCQPLDKRYSDERTESAPVTEIAVSGGSGSVVVEPASTQTVQIKRRFWYDGERPNGRDRMDGSVLRIDTDCGRQCSVDYTIAVPSAVKISGRNGSGTVRLTRVGAVNFEADSGSVTINGAAGDVDVEVDSGEIKVADVSGSVTARADSGGIRLDRISGSVLAQADSGEINVAEAGGEQVTVATQSGSISVAMGKPQTVRASADSGSVRVTVPVGATFDVNVITDSGEAHVEIPTTVGAPNRLDLRTDSGDVRVSPARS